MNIDSVDWLRALTTKNRIDRYPGFYSLVINIFYHFIMADTHRRATLRGFIADLLAASPATPPLDLLKVSTGVSCSGSISFTSDQKTNYQGCSLPQVEWNSNSKNRKLFASICFPIKPEQNAPLKNNSNFNPICCCAGYTGVRGAVRAVVSRSAAQI